MDPRAMGQRAMEPGAEARAAQLDPSVAHEKGARKNSKKLPPPQEYSGTRNANVRLLYPRPQRRIQGLSVRATRKPKLEARTSGRNLPRWAARRNAGGLSQEAPRARCALQSSIVQAEPSDGAPA